MQKSGRLIKRFFDRTGAPALAVGVLILIVFETRFALRRRKESKIKRIKTNLVIAGTASIALRLGLIPILVKLALWNQERKFGFLKLFPKNKMLHFVAAFLVLDYGNYHWHKLNHEKPWLWKMHQVHHADLDLDVSTALRFHFAEVLASAFYRGLWVLMGGVSPQSVLLYEVLFEASNNFQHANLDLGEHADKLLSSLIVTPRMHGIHHSVVLEETNSNYSIVLNIWDRIHRTLNLKVPQPKIEIGLPYVKSHLNATELLIMPFQSDKAIMN